jgi:hypothetical protein
VIILLEHDADEAEVEALARRLRVLGLSVEPLDGPRGRALQVDGPDLGRALAVRGEPGVRAILTRRTPLAGGEPLWPHVALRVGILFLLLVVLLLALVAIAPPGLGDAAEVDGAAAAGGVEWYLRPLAVVVGLVGDAQRGLVGGLAALAWLLLLLWPFVDHADERTPRGRAAASAVRAAGLALLAGWVALALGVAS